MKKYFYGCCAGAQGLYWMYFGIINAFASVFLLSKGYSNTDIGIIFAAGNITAVVMQPLLADVADRAKRISVFGICQIMVLTMIAFSVATIVIPQKTILLTVIYVLMLGGELTLQPLINSFALKIADLGIAVSFSATRCVGSMAYAILCVILGVAIEHTGEIILPIIGDIILASMIVFLFLLAKKFKEVKKEKQNIIDYKPTREKGNAIKAQEGNEHEEINLIAFISQNRMFFLMMVGVVGIYVSNAVLNNFMLQIATPLGGGEKELGRLLSIAACCEVPMFLCFDLIHRKIPYEVLIRCSAIGYAVKIVATWMAPSVNWLLCSQALQMICLPIFLPSMVAFINSIMRRGEEIKGQALFTTMGTVGAVMASLIGGMILDAKGTDTLLLVTTSCTVAGVIIVWLTIGKIPKRK